MKTEAKVALQVRTSNIPLECKEAEWQQILKPNQQEEKDPHCVGSKGTISNSAGANWTPKQQCSLCNKECQPCCGCVKVQHWSLKIPFFVWKSLGMHCPDWVLNWTMLSMGWKDLLTWGRLKEHCVWCCICDFLMPAMDGEDCAQQCCWLEEQEHLNLEREDHDCSSDALGHNGGSCSSNENNIKPWMQKWKWQDVNALGGSNFINDETKNVDNRKMFLLCLANDPMNQAPLSHWILSIHLHWLELWETVFFLEWFAGLKSNGLRSNDMDDDKGKIDAKQKNEPISDSDESHEKK